MAMRVQSYLKQNHHSPTLQISCLASRRPSLISITRMASTTKGVLLMLPGSFSYSEISLSEQKIKVWLQMILPSPFQFTHVSFREEKLPGFQLSVWPWAPINLAAVTRSPCIGGNTSDLDKKGRRAVERGGDWRFWKASSMSAGLEVAYSALSAQASYWKERQNQFPPCRLEKPWSVCRGKQKRSQEERLRDLSSIRRQ